MGASSLSFREGPPEATLLEALLLLPGPIPERIPRPARGNGRSTGGSNTRTVARVPSNWIPSASPSPRPGGSRARGCRWRGRELCHRGHRRSSLTHYPSKIGVKEPSKIGVKEVARSGVAIRGLEVVRGAIVG